MYFANYQRLNFIENSHLLPIRNSIKRLYEVKKQRA